MKNISKGITKYVWANIHNSDLHDLTRDIAHITDRTLWLNHIPKPPGIAWVISLSVGYYDKGVVRINIIAFDKTSTL